MKPGEGKKLVLWAALAIAALIAFIVMRTSTPSQPAAAAPTAEAKLPARSPAPPAATTRPPIAAATREIHPEMDGSDDPLGLSREKIEEYLAAHHRDAASLLAAFHASFDFEHSKADLSYLREAATNFPNDPHVQLAVLSHDAFPEERRQWLDAFKASSPSNSLASYLSAREYFKNNQPDAAIKELVEATAKTQFLDYSMESFLGEEDLFRSSGAWPKITATAAMSAMSQDLLPQLANVKGVINGVSDVQKQYSAAGDAASVQNLAQMGLALANRFNDGDGGRFLISQLVGMAIESSALQSLDQNTAYDFLGGQTPAQRIEALKEQKKSFRELTMVGSGPGVATLPDSELVAYIERVKIYGEVPAMRWLRQQHPEFTPNSGN